MPAMSSAKIHQEKTLLEICLEVMLNEDVSLRKWCKKEQTEWATGELWALFKREVIQEVPQGRLVSQGSL